MTMQMLSDTKCGCYVIKTYPLWLCLGLVHLVVVPPCLLSSTPPPHHSNDSLPNRIDMNR